MPSLDTLIAQFTSIFGGFQSTPSVGSSLGSTGLSIGLGS